MEAAPTCFGLQGNHHQAATASAYSEFTLVHSGCASKMIHPQ